MCRLLYLSAETGPRSFRRLLPHGLAPRCAEFLLYDPTEITPDCPLMAGSALRHSGFEQLLRPRLTSVRPSRHLTTLVALGRLNRSPRVIRATFLLMPGGSTSQRCVQVLGFGNFGYLTPLRRLIRLIRRKLLTLTGQPSAVQRCAFVCSSGQHFASDLTATDGGNADFAGFAGAKTCPAIHSQPRHPCLWLTIPLGGCLEDFHLQVTSVATTAKRVALARNAPCLAHQIKMPLN
jgi:hypothetical protein